MGCFRRNVREERRGRSRCAFDNLPDPLDRDVAHHRSRVVLHRELKVPRGRAARVGRSIQLSPRVATEAIRNASACVLRHERGAVVVSAAVRHPRTGWAVKTLWNHREVPVVQVFPKHAGSVAGGAEVLGEHGLLHLEVVGVHAGAVPWLAWAVGWGLDVVEIHASEKLGTRRTADRRMNEEVQRHRAFVLQQGLRLRHGSHVVVLRKRGPQHLVLVVRYEPSVARASGWQAAVWTSEP